MKKILASLMALGLALSLAACSTSSPVLPNLGFRRRDCRHRFCRQRQGLARRYRHGIHSPFEYTDENGNFVGIDVDILAAIAEDQGFKYELNSIGWDGAVAAVQTGQADAIIAGASIKQDRIDSGWIFSDGCCTATRTVFAVPEDSDITSFEDLRGTRRCRQKRQCGRRVRREPEGSVRLHHHLF